MAATATSSATESSDEDNWWLLPWRGCKRVWRQYVTEVEDAVATMVPLPR